MGLRLQRALGASPSPGQYTTVGLGYPDAIALVCCRACGGLDVIEAGEHVVDRGGRVTPAWRCPTVTCSEVEWLELDSW